MQPSPESVLAVLADFPEGMSLPRLAKRLGARASTVLRALAPLGEAGAGWVSIDVRDDEWRIALTDAGRAGPVMLKPGPAPVPCARQEVEVRRVRAGHLQDASTDLLAEEVPVALEYNGISHATLLATPADLEDFARGFSYTEGIIDAASDIRGIDVEPTPQGLVVQIEIATAREVRLKARRRALAGRTGCGLCGVESLEDVQRVLAPLDGQAPLALPRLGEALRRLRAGQSLHEDTGATHAAAWFDAEGRLLCLREDVGRHNALDKMIGATLGAERRAGFAVVSSRASFEMVQKSVAAGIHTLVAVSAPTALAVRLARDSGLLLLGFGRGDSATVYTHPERIVG